ncbi:hypothetical protein [Pedobacter duraquae]|uniref:Uncharacterized protein n=1 Tax=Pedobacter duraquae TaxID=425511 RepID=A0A4R6IQM6_9SPHI|nr:hypothetical protein [Pedobacter duraquae]TDO24639.1 hypothetical protein CLV32_0931 [Pedobacter duraquae]
MEKIEYGDVNKFLVSIGLILIVLSFIIPYYSLKEDFGVYLENSKIMQLQPHMQILILRKQMQVAFLQDIIPYISILLFSGGVLISQWGLCRWFKRQKSIDEKFDTELAKSKLELTAMSPVEVFEKAQNEVDEIEAANTEESQTPTSNNSLIEYLKVEERVYNLFKNNRNKNFETYSQMRLGQIEIDIVMASKSSAFLDRIIEIKYYQTNFNHYVVDKALVQLNNKIIYYKSNTNRNAVPVLMIIYEPNTLGTGNIPSVQAQVIEWASQYPDLNHLKIVFSTISEIETFDVKILLKK